MTKKELVAQVQELEEILKKTEPIRTTADARRRSSVLNGTVCPSSVTWHMLEDAKLVADLETFLYDLPKPCSELSEIQCPAQLGRFCGGIK